MTCAWNAPTDEIPVADLSCVVSVSTWFRSWIGVSHMTREQSVIKVDIDTPGPRCIMETDMALLFRDTVRLLRRAGYKPVALSICPSPGGKGTHLYIYVTPRPKSPYEVVALQLLLGSDPNREAMQMHRARSFFNAPRWMRDAWNVLYLPDPQRIRHLTLEQK